MLFERVSDFTEISLLDYPGNVSTILFYHGCTIKCPYCYNSLIVKNEIPLIGGETVQNYIKRRKNILDAVVFSGGECTLHPGLYDDINFCKSLGLKIKLDTNGTNDKMVRRLLEENLLDYVALDYKCPEDKKNIFGFTDKLYNNFINSLENLLEFNVPFEVRTTIHADITSEGDVNNILKDLFQRGYSGKYYLQFYFRGTEDPLGQIKPPSRIFDLEKIEEFDNISLHLRNEMDNSVI